MLELSSLVSSEEPLPLAETDLGLLCAERLQIQRELSQNPSVEYVLKGGVAALASSRPMKPT